MKLTKEHRARLRLLSMVCYSRYMLSYVYKNAYEALGDEHKKQVKRYERRAEHYINRAMRIRRIITILYCSTTSDK